VRADRASRTAQALAGLRASESLLPEGVRLFEDPLAHGFLNAAYKLLFALSRWEATRKLLALLYDRRLPGALANAACRVRYVDDCAKDALGGGAEQVVILGAGFDSRAYRIPGMERVRVFEVDHPATQAEKRKRLVRLLGEIPPHVVFVPIDFTRQALEKCLAEAGYRVDATTCFLWEGVINYLTAEAVDATFRFIGSHSAPGSRVAFTYPHAGILDGSADFEGARELAEYVRRLDEPFTFGFLPEELPGYLAARGLELIEDMGAAEYRERYPSVLERPGSGPSEFARAALARVRGER
jgi:methyltransferase (TIGR00027 family)